MSDSTPDKTGDDSVVPIAAARAKRGPKPKVSTPDDQHDDNSDGSTTTVVKIKWTDQLLRSGTDRKSPPRKVLANALVALRHAPEWKKAFCYDVSALTVILLRPTPWEDHAPQTTVPPSAVPAKFLHDVGDWKPRLWTDQDDRLWAEWLQKRRIDLSVALAGEAVQTVAREVTFHPIQDYLTALQWDGEARIDTWLEKYMGVEDSAYTRAVGARWLISGVARVMSPGVKADSMLVLEGDQNLGKSTAVAILAGRREWFTDETKELGTRDSAMGIAGRWIVEFGELEAFKGSSVERLKAFLSRTVDRYRPPWGRMVNDYPRQCIFIGTTNPQDFLRDMTGNRRFWPVYCTRPADLAGLGEVRDQIWAEALVRYRAGERWWLDTPELRTLAHEVQETRMVVDPWEEVVSDYLEAKGLDEISSNELLEEGLKIELARATIADQKRVAGVLRHMGWSRTRVWSRNSTYPRGAHVFRAPEIPTQTP